MFDADSESPDMEKRVHDEVFIQSIDRKERVVKFVSQRLGIDIASARDDSTVCDILLQLIREDNPLVDSDGLSEAVQVYLEEYLPDSDLYYEDSYRNPESSDLRKNSFYDRTKAKAYIDNYWKDYNPDYPSFHQGGGDCTNFVSQVLHAGGMPFADDQRPVNYTLGRNWYCKPGATSKDGDRRITLSWKVAALFKGQWVGRVYRHTMKSYSEVLNSINDVSASVYIGDMVQFCYPSGVPYHTLAVTGFNRDPEYNIEDIVLASHTIDSNRRSLYRTLMKFPHDYKLRIYVIKNGE